MYNKLNLKLATRRRQKKNNHTAHAWFSGFSLQQIRPVIMKSAERYDLAKTK